jgi:hypothetical protein
MALLRNSPLNFAGAGESQEAGKMEQEGTSHAQNQEGQEHVTLQKPDEGDSVVSFPVVSLPIPAGKEENEVHPPIRKVRGLTPPGKSPEETRSPSNLGTDPDPDFEKFFQRLKTREELRDEIQRLTTVEARLRSSTIHLEQHVQVQGQCIRRMQHRQTRLEAVCVLGCFCEAVA